MQRRTGFSRTLILSIILFSSFFFPKSIVAKSPATPGTAIWADVEKLADDQKLQAAIEKVDAILGDAVKNNDVRIWTEGLIRSTQLRVGLHGYETAVRNLKDSKWPADPAGRVLLNLFYAHALMQYQQIYSWEINGREKTVSNNAVDLKAWTTAQIGQEIRRNFDDVMKNGPALDQPAPEFFSTYIQKNDYPASVRPVLRDLVVYMAIRHLSNSQYWMPRESSEVYKNNARLLASKPPVKRISAADENEHPLLKVASWLGEHSEFHLKAGRKEGAMNARYELFAVLQSAMSESADQLAIREELKSYQLSNREFPWWSRGQAMLAQMTRSTDRPTREIEAREQALMGLRAFPDSIGGKMCASILGQIERPEYSVVAMETDNLNRRTLLLNYKNLTKLYFRAYAMNPDELLKKPRGGSEILSIDHVRDAMRKNGLKAISEWSVDVPKTNDYLSHRKFVIPPLKKMGLYTIAISSRADFSGSNDVVQGVRLLLSDYVLASTNEPDGTLETRLVSGEKGTPVGNVEVQLYRFKWSEVPIPVEAKRTSGDGFVRFQEPSKSRNDYWNYFVVARDGDQSAFEMNGIYFNKASEVRKMNASLVFTDRSIFRPGQKVFWKIASYSGDPSTGAYQVAPKNTVSNVRLVDPNNQTVETKIVKTGEFGTASGEFVIPAGRPLGGWRVEATGGHHGSSSIRVEEYKRPTFEASLDESIEPLRLNRKAKIAGSSKYYFGQPVTGGSVSWRVTRQEVYPFWWAWRYWGYRPVQAEMVASGDSKVGADGKFEIQFTPEADERKSATSGLTYNFSIEVNVTDEGGETRSTTRSYRLGFVSVEASLAQNAAYFETGKDVSFAASLRSLDGKARAGKAKYRLVKLKQPLQASLPADLPRDGTDENGISRIEEARQFATTDDSKRARWETSSNWKSISENWSDGAEITRGDITHDAMGAGTIKLPPFSESGIYRIHYETKDDFGATFKLSQNILVAAARPKISVPIVFLTEANSVEVGSKAKFFLHSGIVGLPLQIETFRAGKRVNRRTWIAGKDSSYFEVPIVKEDRGSISVSVAGFRDHQLIREELTVTVPWTDRRLDLEFSTFRDTLRPGAQETFKVTVKGSDKKSLARGASEVLAYMYDRSLDAFGSHDAPSPMSSYASRYGLLRWNVTLGQSSAHQWYGNFNYVQGYPSLRDDSLNFPNRYGIGGPGRRGGIGGGRGRFSRNDMMNDEVSFSAMPMAAPAVAEREMMKSARSESDSRSNSAIGQLSSKKLEESSGKSDASGGSAEAPASEIRSNFSETAFFSPHLIAGADGVVSFEFKVPDSVTSWNVYAHALTKDWRGGSVSKETKSVKELMIRPYAPRFLREGDVADIKVQVNNASDGPLSGEVVFDIENPDTGKSVAKLFGLGVQDLKKNFSMAKGGAATVAFSVKAPREIGSYVFRAVGKSKKFSDGELRPFPVLPSRMHLAQSRFVSLKNQDSKVLEFKDLAAADDPTLLNEKMVVTVDAQLFYGVLKSLPYLVNYPYECIEQTLNRFLATGVVSSVFSKYPSIEKMAKEMSARKTALAAFDEPDANRRMTLEESPWLENAKGGAADEKELAKILDSRVAADVRDKALKRIRKMQLANGAFPWFEGGPSNEYMTLYVLMGFGRALEFGVEVPKDIVKKGWSFTRQWLDSEIETMMSRDCCWEFITMVNYAISLYPDNSYTGGLFDDAYRKRLLDYSFKHWKSHSPLLKGYLALTLNRLDRKADAKLVWDSVMDSAKSDDQIGTYWAAEDRSWLWYNDTIETHAFSLRTLMELDPADKRSEGLVQWLFLNKKMNHWKSTRATAEAIYSLVHYLDKTKTLGVREVVKVDAGTQKTEFVFEPEKYTGAKNQLVIPGDKMNAKKSARITVEKTTPGFAFASATWHFSTDRLPKEDSGDFFNVSRKYYRREALKNAKGGSEWVLKPLADGQKISIGDQIEVQISLRSKHEAEYVHLRDPRAAGLEPENVVSGYKWDLGLSWFEEVRDSGTNFFFTKIPVGEYTFRYRLRANMAGVFRVGPATVQSLYAPEFNAYSSGTIMTVETK